MLSKNYNQLTLADRKNIKIYLTLGKSQSEIGRLIGKSKSTISREINRNSRTIVLKSSYSAHAAHKLALKRRKPVNNHYKFRELRCYIESNCKDVISIHQIYSDFKMLHPNYETPVIQTVYN
jgi:IS30 family transposase